MSVNSYSSGEDGFTMETYCLTLSSNFINLYLLTFPKVLDFFFFLDLDQWNMRDSAKGQCYSPTSVGVLLQSPQRRGLWRHFWRFSVVLDGYWPAAGTTYGLRLGRELSSDSQSAPPAQCSGLCVYLIVCFIKIPKATAKKYSAILPGVLTCHFHKTFCSTTF